MLDVGHGDSLIIEFPKGDAFGIIDCNLHGSTNRLAPDSGEPKALSFFRNVINQGRKPVIEFVCLTHPHYDHYAGMAELLEGLMKLNVPIKELWDFGASVSKAQAMRKAARLPEEKKATEELTRLCKFWFQLQEAPHASQPRVLGSPQKGCWSRRGVTIDLLAPHGKTSVAYWNFLNCKTEAQRKRWRKKFPLVEDDNCICSAFLLRYGKCRLLLGSDLTNDSWQLILKSKRGELRRLACHGAKVCHHGSLDGNFLEPWNSSESINPKDSIWPYVARKGKARFRAAISGGYRAGLPHDFTLEALRSADAQTFCTGALDPKMTKLKPFIPPGMDREVFLTELVGHIWEASTGGRSGHGDITISCFKGGRCEMHSELQTA